MVFLFLFSPIRTRHGNVGQRLGAGLETFLLSCALPLTIHNNHRSHRCRCILYFKPGLHLFLPFLTHFYNGNLQQHRKYSRCQKHKTLDVNSLLISKLNHVLFLFPSLLLLIFHSRLIFQASTFN